ncbi:C2H2-type zinc finger protein [Pseudomonas sp. Ant30-3]|uniref:C2H2-type zinc finger protein n=1 Tax=Pseudomonas sp. Ant30-3 TaxID=1488328 RepID=UPI001F262B69|nr:C2H2-type zinc finger protein [Pseudomonas sp. Ant30-3]
MLVIEPRGLAVRDVAYWRAEIVRTAETRVTRQVFDAAGRRVEQWDARLPMPALSHAFSLSGKVLASDSVDAGWRLALLEQADQSVSRWDSRGTRQDTEYDSLLRPRAVTEQAHADKARVVERFDYGAAGAEFNLGNQCGRLIRHDDPAGTRHMPEYDVRGSAQCEISHFLASLDAPDWPLNASERDQLLEPGPGLESRWAYNPVGDLLSLTDAHSHRRRFAFTVAGQLKAGWLQPAGAAAPGQCLVQDIRYNPGGQVEREAAGNGVVTEARYTREDGRLLRLSAGLPGAPLLQDLHYQVDAIGNILQIDDHALPIRHFQNQRIERTCIYAHDTLGQLIRAIGWEAERAAPLPVAAYRSSSSANAVLNYQEEYDYDASGNMIELRHKGAQPFTRRWAVSQDSNRSLLEDEDDRLPDFANGFDDNGNLRFLHRGQPMTWDVRNQLSSVSPVQRHDEDDDCERYVYGGGGKRLRKVHTALVAAHTIVADVRYLPGLEIHQHSSGKQHQVLDLEAGRNRVKWLQGPHAPAFQLRYHLTDHLGSGVLELDEQANVQSREVYYPFGGTAYEDHSDQTGAYKTSRYSGKERDATGLYYYGYRYFAPWLSRWINPDPAGAVDGLNLYCFVSNSPVGHVDVDGRMMEDDDWAIPENIDDIAEANGTLSLQPIVLEEGDLGLQDSNLNLESVQGSTNPLAELDFHLMAVRTSTALIQEPAFIAEMVAGAFRESSQDALMPSILEQAPIAEREKKSLTCPTCGKFFRYNSRLNTHLMLHTGVRPFKCDVGECGKSFVKKSNLVQHIRTHTGVKAFKCDVADCGKSFAEKFNLVQHMRTHTGEKPYACTVCGRLFSSFNHSKTHMRTHTGEKPYQCLTCNKSFTRRDILNVHIRTHTRETIRMHAPRV